MHYGYGFFQYVAYRGHSFMTFTKNKEREVVWGTECRPVLLMAVHGFWGRVIFYSCGRRHVRQPFFSVICKDLLH